MNKQTPFDRIVGLVVKASASRAADLGSIPAFPVGLFPGRDLNTGTPVAALPGAWRYGVSSGTGWPDVNVLCLDEIAGLICNFCLSVAGRRFSEEIRP